MKLSTEYTTLLKSALERSGQRATKQREQVFSVLMHKRDHPTADEIYARSRAEMPSISLATVYNCLDTLTESGLIRAVNFEREPTRYCPNLTQHAHFYCKSTGEIVDIELNENIIQQLKSSLPDGFHVDHIELTYDGQCPDCKNTP